MSTLRGGIDRFEADVAEYEARGQPKPSDEILRAVLLQLVPENLGRTFGIEYSEV